MKRDFNPTDLRILGVLIEKALTTPASYPLTINALVTGANQQQNRDPVLSLTEADVTRSLSRLQQYNVVEQAPPSANARSNRYCHCASERFNWDKREQAVMAELLLRGRQTAGELRNRAIRMTSIPDMSAIHAILAGLIDRDLPFIKELQREPGRSTNRFQHLLDEDVHTEGMVVVHDDSCLEASGEAASPIDGNVSDRLTALENRMEALVTRVARLEHAQSACSADSPINADRNILPDANAE